MEVLAPERYIVGDKPIITCVASPDNNKTKLMTKFLLSKFRYMYVTYDTTKRILKITGE